MPECLQNIYGPTPCFRDAGMVGKQTEGLPCGLEECPVAEYLLNNTNTTGWKALHSICVITDSFDYKGDFKPIQLKLIVQNKK